jgi:hypothetical protein
MHKAQVRLEADESSIEIEIGIEIEIDSVLRLPRFDSNRYRFRFRFRFQMGARRVQLAPWHWQRVASVAQQQLGFLDIFSWLRRGLAAAWSQLLAIRLLLVPSVSGSESGSGSIPLVCHRNYSVPETIGPADIRDRFTVHNVSRVQIPSFVLRFRFRYRPRPRL